MDSVPWGYTVWGLLLLYPNTFAYEVPMEDIITANGQRFSDHLNSQKYFNVGSVVLSTEELSQ